MSNPAPRLTIVSMDVVSPLNRANVLLVGAAITSSDQSLEPCPSPPGPEPFRAVIKFLIKDDAVQAARTPAAKPETATLQWTAIGPGLIVEFPAFAADSAGHLAIDVPLQPLSEIRYQATGPNGATAQGTLVKDENCFFPHEQELSLKIPRACPFI